MFKLIAGLDYINVEGSFALDRFHAEAIFPMLTALFRFQSFHFWPFIFILILMLNWNKAVRLPLAWLFALLLGAVIAYSFLYLFTPTAISAIGQTAFSRSMFHLIPTSIFLAGLLFQKSKIIVKFP
ncbi:hypothetical protein MYX07_04100 [Patescibacteria group bacterium AH-259-L07]|nr:hypothetical protein [Patescibacteria group bacterium AH-259-L07]